MFTFRKYRYLCLEKCAYIYRIRLHLSYTGTLQGVNISLSIRSNKTHLFYIFSVKNKIWIWYVYIFFNKLNFTDMNVSNIFKNVMISTYKIKLSYKLKNMKKIMIKSKKFDSS